MITSLTKQVPFTFALVALTISGVVYANNKTKYDGSMKNIPHAVITFSSDSANFTDSDRANLQEVIRRTLAKTDIEQVTVAAWSDKNMPKQGEFLTDSDRSLAKSRIDAISDFIKSDMNTVDLETYNMAENSNWLARTFKTSDSELKSIFSKKGAAAPVTNSEFQLIKNEGGPYQAVVVIQRKMHR